MAYLIECDRCGRADKIGSSCGVPTQWLQFSDIEPGTLSEAPTIKGGVFCPACIRALDEWRKPIPRCAPMDPEQFKKRA